MCFRKTKVVSVGVFPLFLWLLVQTVYNLNSSAEKLSYQWILQEESHSIDLLSIQIDKYESSSSSSSKWFYVKNEDFDQRLGCAAPKGWSKYTTGLYTRNIFCPSDEVHF